jgi:hypothetical protein
MLQHFYKYIVLTEKHVTHEMADAKHHAANTEDTLLHKDLTTDYTCKQRLELLDQLKDALRELNSAHLIIELLQQESATMITSKQHDINRNNISQEIADQVQQRRMTHLYLQEITQR